MYVYTPGNFFVLRHILSSEAVISLRIQEDPLEKKPANHKACIITTFYTAIDIAYRRQ